MKRKNTTSIKTNKTNKNIAPVDIMGVSEIADLPNTEPPLYRKDEYFTPAATSAPIVSSLRAQLRKDLWSQDPSGLAYFLHHAKGNPKNLIEHHISNQGRSDMSPGLEM